RARARGVSDGDRRPDLPAALPRVRQGPRHARRGQARGGEAVLPHEGLGRRRRARGRRLLHRGSPPRALSTGPFAPTRERGRLDHLRRDPPAAPARHELRLPPDLTMTKAFRITKDTTDTIRKVAERLKRAESVLKVGILEDKGGKPK